MTLNGHSDEVTESTPLEGVSCEFLGLREQMKKLDEGVVGD